MPNKLSLYPNPASSSVMVKAKQKMNNVTIFTLLGEEVFRKDGIGEPEVKVDLEKVDSGTYFLQVLGVNGNIFVSKLIVN